MTDLSATITIGGPKARLSGMFPIGDIREALSFAKPGAEYSEAFQKGYWDGRTHLCTPKGVFPSGLVPEVVRILEENQIPVEIKDEWLIPEPLGKTFDLQGIKMEGKYSYQMDVCEAMVAHGRGVVSVATNGGKCLSPETEVLLFSGEMVCAGDVEVGQLLMGPDSSPREVTSVCRGSSPMYQITPNKGDPWQCNDVHVLTLVHTVTGKIIDIPLDEYLKKGPHFKHCHKLFTTGVEFPVSSSPLPVDPYFVGLWLGDGSKDLPRCSVAVTSKDLEIRDYLVGLAAQWNLVCKDISSTDRCPTYSLTNRKDQRLRKEMLRMFPSKHSIKIPQEYLTASRGQRLLLLAGLVDSDGYLHNGSYEICQKNRDIAEGIAFLARSLGYRAGIRPKIVRQFNPGGVVYQRVTIVGDLTDVPVILERKKVPPRRRKHNPLRTGFSVIPCPEGPYAGFTLSGDGRFLLGDFTVTHNTAIAAATTSYYSRQTLYVVTSKDLMYQGQKDFQRMLGCTDYEVGIAGDGRWQPGDWITIALMDTLVARLHKKECKDLLNSAEVLFVDECHHSAAETHDSVTMKCAAPIRFGLSGTPLDRTDGSDLRLLGSMGPVIATVTNKELMDRGVSAKTGLIFDSLKDAGGLAYNAQYQTAYKKGIVENAELLEKVVDWTKIFYEEGLSVLVLCEEIKQGKAIDKALWEETGGLFIPHQFIHGDLASSTRSSALEDFGSRNLPVLVASRILDEGVDVPTVDALILAGSRKSRIKTMQRLGRGLRGEKLIVVEFANYTNRHLLSHSLARLEDYQKEDCLEIHNSTPDKELVQQLWHTDLLRAS